MHARIAVALLLALAPTSAAAGGKKYFLTPDPVNAGGVREACGKGYHLAALWELFDFAELKYDAKRGQPPQTGAGFGPPATLFGWVSTGGDDSAANVPGEANCLDFTTAGLMDYGTIVALSGAWDAPATAVSPWVADTSVCAQANRVWCVKD